MGIGRERTIPHHDPVLSTVITRTSSREHGVGCTLLAGGIIIVIGLGSSWLFFAAGAHVAMATRDPITDHVNNVGPANWIPLSLTLTVIGVLMVVGALIYGATHHSRGRSGTPREIEHFRVLAKYGTDRAGNLLTEYYQIEAEERVRLYVRGVLPDGSVDEFEVPMEVFHACGEGMTGKATVQGRWLGGFMPYIGVPGTQ